MKKVLYSCRVWEPVLVVQWWTNGQMVALTFVQPPEAPDFLLHNFCRELPCGYIRNVTICVWYTYPCVEFKFIIFEESTHTVSFHKIHQGYCCIRDQGGSDRSWRLVLGMLHISNKSGPLLLAKALEMQSKLPYALHQLLMGNMKGYARYTSLCGISIHYLWGMQILCMKLTFLSGISNNHLYGS